MKYIFFRKNTSSKDVQLLSRIQIELDSFLLRSCNFLYNSQNLGIWQYLSGLPFSNLSIKSIWKLYYCLHNKHFDNVIENNTVGSRFYSKYLLNRIIKYNLFQTIKVKY